MSVGMLALITVEHYQLECLSRQELKHNLKTKCHSWEPRQKWKGPKCRRRRQHDDFYGFYWSNSLETGRCVQVQVNILPTKVQTQKAQGETAARMTWPRNRKIWTKEMCGLGTEGWSQRPQAWGLYRWVEQVWRAGRSMTRQAGLLWRNVIGGLAVGQQRRPTQVQAKHRQRWPTEGWGQAGSWRLADWRLNMLEDSWPNTSRQGD